MRTGMLAKKLGMTRVYDSQRVHNSVTVLEVPDTKVIGQKNREKDGYDAVVLGTGKIKQKRINKAQKEFFSKLNIEPTGKIKEFRVSYDNLVDTGSSIMVSHFVVGQYVDVQSFSLGKGFAGAMKRHNFAGLRASHGVSVSHRSHGSTGNSQDPGKVWKGKKMAGQLGNKKTTIQSLEVISIDEERGLVLVKGGVPGSVGSWVSISDAKKRSLPANVPYPAGTRKISKDLNEKKANSDAENSISNLDEKNNKNEVADSDSKEQINKEKVND